MDIKKIDKKIIKIIFFVGIMLLIVIKFDYLLLFVTKLLGVLSTVFIGFAIAYVLNILVRFVETKIFPRPTSIKKKNIYRGCSIVTAFIMVLIVLAILLTLVIPELVNATITFIKTVPDSMNQISKFAKKYAEQLPTIEQYLESNPNLAEGLIKYVDAIIKYLTTNSLVVIESVFGAVTTIVMGIIIAIYILFDKEGLKDGIRRLFHRYLGSKVEQKIYYVLSIANNAFKSYIVGQTIEAIILGILCIGGLYILRFPYAIMIGVIIGFTGLIPILGAYIGGIFGFLMILSKSPSQAILFIVFLLVLQQVENNVIYPRVVGSSVGLPSILVVISILIAGGFFGIVGVFLAVPFTATIYKVIANDITRHTAKKEKLNS